MLDSSAPGLSRWTQRLSLQTRLFATGIGLTVFPLAVAALVTWSQNRTIQDEVKAGIVRLADSDLGHIADDVVAMCGTSRALLDKWLERDARAAADLLRQEGGIRFGQDPVVWEAANQFSQNKLRVSLPKVHSRPTCWR